MDDKRHCPKCNKEVHYDAVVCTGCGRALPRTKWSGGAMFGLTVASFLCPLAGFIIGGMALASRDDDKKSQGAQLITVGVVGFLVAILWMFTGP